MLQQKKQNAAPSDLWNTFNLRHLWLYLLRAIKSRSLSMRKRRQIPRSQSQTTEQFEEKYNSWFVKCSQYSEKPIMLDLDGQFLSLMKLLKCSLSSAVAFPRGSRGISTPADRAPVSPPVSPPPTLARSAVCAIDVSWVACLLLEHPGPWWTPCVACLRFVSYKPQIHLFHRHLKRGYKNRMPF